MATDITHGTAIEWTHVPGMKGESWNPLSGCSSVSEGCRNCYAVAKTRRLATFPHTKEKYGGLLNAAGTHFNGIVRCHERELERPLRWTKPRCIFVNSMSDLFHANVPFEFIGQVFAVAALCPQHLFIVLTKRPEIAAEWYGRRGRQTEDGEPLSNVYLYTSIEDQPSADKRIPELLKCPAALFGLSIEPLLGPVDLNSSSMPEWWNWNGGIGHVLVGGESGPNARPCDVAWIRSIRDQCAAAGVPCFVKQDSGPKPGRRGRIPDDLWAVKEFPAETGWIGLTNQGKLDENLKIETRCQVGVPDRHLPRRLRMGPHAVPSPRCSAREASAKKSGSRAELFRLRAASVSNPAAGL